MALANVNVGTGPSAGNGDSLRSAFITINENFTELNANVEAISHPVTSVAGRTGNVVLTKNDIIGLDNIEFTMANATHWTSNVTTLSAAINQLAERIYNIENP